VTEFEHKMENKPNASGPSTKEFVGAKTNQAREFVSDRSKEVSALGLIIATAIGDACLATQNTIYRYKKLLMAFMAMIFVGFCVQHEIKQSNEIYSLS
jgi:hypothetical protein